MVTTKYRYLIVDENYNITGTNSEELALRLTDSEMVYDLQTGYYLDQDGSPKEEIPEHKE